MKTPPKSPGAWSPPQAAEPVIRDLIALAWKNLPLLILGLALGIGAGLWVYSRTTAIYESQAKFMIGKVPYLDRAGSADAQTESQLIQTLILSIPSRDMHRAVAERLGIDPNRLAFTAIDLKKKLTGPLPEANIRIDAVRDTRIGEISVRSQDREFAAQVANTLLDQLALYNVVGGRLSNLETSIALARTKTDNLLKQLADISAERIKTEQENAELDAHLSRSLALADFPTFATDATLNNLKTQLILVESEYRQLATTASRGPRLEGKRSEVESLRRQLNAHAQALAGALRAEFQIAKTREQDVSEEVRQLTASIDSYNAEAATLSQSLSESQKMRRFAEDPKYQGAPTASVITTINPATPAPKPIQPKLWLNLLLGTVFGAALGAGATALRILLDNRIKSAAQIAALTGLPTLALLPKFQPLYRGSNRRSIFEHGDYPIGLGFLRSELIRHEGNRAHRIIGISSIGTPRPFPNLAANLAVLLAQAGKRTLVIDLHFAAPRQPSLLGIRCREGLAEWFASDRPLDAFINQFGDPNLGVISPGHSNRDIDDLFSRRPLLQHLEPLLENWDHVLLDAPPLLADWTLTLALPARHALILTADYGKTSFEDLQKAGRTSASHDWDVLGVVLQRCPRSVCPSDRRIVSTPASAPPVKAPDLPAGQDRRQ